MAQENKNRPKPWIASDLLKFPSQSYTHRFKGSTHLARVIITEDGECLLEDGHNKILAVFTSASRSTLEWKPHRQPVELKHGTTIRILTYTFDIITTQDENCQFVLVVNNWQHTTDDLNGGLKQSTDVNSLEAVRNCLCGCFMTWSGADRGSGLLQQRSSQNLSRLGRPADHSQSQNLTSQSNSQNLSFLATLASQSDSQDLTNQSSSQNLYCLARLANQSNSQNLASQSESQNLASQSIGHNLANQSDSQNLASSSNSQILSCLARLANQSDSQNMLTLARLSNQSDSHNVYSEAKLTNMGVNSSPIQYQLQQKYTQKESGMKPASFTPRGPSKNVSHVTSSTGKSKNDMSVICMKETSFSEIKPRNSKNICRIASRDSCYQGESIQQRDQDFGLSHQADYDKLRDASQMKTFVPEAQQNKKTDRHAVTEPQDKKTGSHAIAEEHISASQLLELMAQESIQDSSQKSDKQKVNHTDGSKPTVACHKSPSLHGGKCELPTPTYWDLFVPPDQLKILAQLPGWTSSDGSSVSSFPSKEFLRPSSYEKSNSSSSGSLFSQPTMKDEGKQNSHLPHMDSISSQSADSFTEKDLIENLNQHRKNSVVTKEIDFYDKQNSNKSKLDKNNSLSLFSDTEQEVSPLVIGLKSGLREEYDGILQRQVNICEGDENNVLTWAGIILKSNTSEVPRQSNERVVKKGNEQVSRQPQLYESSQRKTREINDEVNLKTFKGQQENRKCPRLRYPSVVSERKYGTQSSESSTRMLTLTAQHEISDNSPGNPAMMSRVIDLSSSSSSGDIYMIAGHDADSSSENTMPLTEPEVIVSSTDSEKLIISTDSEKLISSSSDSANVFIDSEKLVSSSSDSSNVLFIDSEKLVSSADSESIVLDDIYHPSVDTKSVVHIKPSSSALHTPLYLNTISKQQRVKDQQDTDRHQTTITSSIRSSKAKRTRSSRSEDVSCTVQDFKVTSGCQKTLRLNSSCWQNVVSNGQATPAATRCNSSPSGSTSGGLYPKPADVETACQVVLENAETTISQGKKKKPNEPLPTQKSQLDKSPACLDRPQKNQICLPSKENTSGRQSFSSSYCQHGAEIPESQPKINFGQKNRPSKSLACLDHPQKSEICLPSKEGTCRRQSLSISSRQYSAEIPVSQPKIVLTDVLKNNITTDCFHLRSILNADHPSLITRNKRQQILPKTSENTEENIKYSRTRPSKRKRCDGMSQRSFKKKAITVNIREIGKDDTNVLKIQTLEQSIGRTSRVSSSRKVSINKDINKTTRFTKIRKPEADQINRLESPVEPIQSVSYTVENSGSISRLLKVVKIKKAVTTKDGQTLEYKNQQPDLFQVSAVFKNISGATAWENIVPVLDCSRELKETRNSSWSVTFPTAFSPSPAPGNSSHLGKDNTKFPTVTPERQGFVSPELGNSSHLGKDNTKFRTVTPERQGFVSPELGNSSHLGKDNTTFRTVTPERQGFVSPELGNSSHLGKDNTKFPTVTPERQEFVSPELGNSSHLGKDNTTFRTVTPERQGFVSPELGNSSHLGKDNTKFRTVTPERQGFVSPELGNSSHLGKDNTKFPTVTHERQGFVSPELGNSSHLGKDNTKFPTVTPERQGFVSPELGNSSDLRKDNTKFTTATPERQGFVSCHESRVGVFGSSVGFVKELTESVIRKEDENRDSEFGHSSGFVPEFTELVISSSKHEDSRRGAVESSEGFVPGCTDLDPTMTDSEDWSCPWVCARLDKSVATVINYVCHGKIV